MAISELRLLRNPRLSEAALNELFAASWAKHRPRSFAPIFERSLAYFAAVVGERLVGFVNVAWDGGIHGFILDTTVHPEFRRRGLASALLAEAARAAREAGLHWLHADFPPELEPLYRRAGYRTTAAGLLELGAAAARG